MPTTHCFTTTTCATGDSKYRAARALKHHRPTPSAPSAELPGGLEPNQNYPCLHRSTHRHQRRHQAVHTYTSHADTRVYCYTRSPRPHRSTLPARTQLYRRFLDRRRRQSHLPSASSCSKTRICSKTNSGIRDMIECEEERREVPTEAIRNKLLLIRPDRLSGR